MNEDGWREGGREGGRLLHRKGDGEREGGMNEEGEREGGMDGGREVIT